MMLFRAWKESLFSGVAVLKDEPAILGRTYKLWFQRWWLLLFFVCFDQGWRVWSVVRGHTFFEEFSHLLSKVIVSETLYTLLVSVGVTLLFVAVYGLAFFALCASVIQAITQQHTLYFSMRRFIWFMGMVVVLLCILMSFCAADMYILRNLEISCITSLLFMYRNEGTPFLAFSLFLFLELLRKDAVSIKTLYRSIVQGMRLCIYIYPIAFLTWNLIYTLHVANHALYKSYYYIPCDWFLECGIYTVVIAGFVKTFVKLFVIYPLSVSWWFALCERTKHLIKA